MASHTAPGGRRHDLIRMRGPTGIDSAHRPHILIIGGGLVGLTSAWRLQRALSNDDAVVTLVNDQNHMVYQSLLPEVASGMLEPADVVVPLRRTLRRTRVIAGRLTDLHADRHVAVITPIEAEPREIAYDHLVLALGSETKVLPVPGLAEHAVGFTTVPEALFLRDHVLARLEATEHATDQQQRRRALTFVFVGGGYSGVEALGELQSMAQAASRWYPSVSSTDQHWILVEATDGILPMVDDRLADAATNALQGPVRDCAAVPDLVTGGVCPPSAQYALRQARQRADNITAAVRGQRPELFRYDQLGELLTLGRHDGIAQIRDRHLRGPLPWYLRRLYHIGRIPARAARSRSGPSGPCGCSSAATSSASASSADPTYHSNTPPRRRPTTTDVGPRRETVPARPRSCGAVAGTRQPGTHRTYAHPHLHSWRQGRRWLPSGGSGRWRTERSRGPHRAGPGGHRVVRRAAGRTGPHPQRQRRAGQAARRRWRTSRQAIMLPDIYPPPGSARSWPRSTKTTPWRCSGADRSGCSRSCPVASGHLNAKLLPSASGRIIATGLWPARRVTVRVEVSAMAKDHGPSVKDDEQYERLREQGESKEKAARIANTDRSTAGKRGGTSGSYEDWTKDDLLDRAREIGIEGRSDMTKDELIDALRDH